jgi:branched-chain amino acid transport system substrate-binding protein
MMALSGRLAWFALLLAIGLFRWDAAAADGLSLLNLIDRDEPAAASVADGVRDYIAMIDARDGGVNGIAVDYRECDSGDSAEKSVQCLDDAKASAIAVVAWSATTAMALLPASGRDGIPLLAPAGGPAMVADGRYFPWAFAMPATGLDAAQAVLDAIAGKPPALNGKTIALLRTDTPEGADALAFLQGRSTPLGFSLLDLPVPRKELQTQAAAWTEIGSKKPDYVVIAGPAAMNAAALGAAEKARFPMNRVIGISWSASETELAPLGDAAKGYRMASWNLPSASAKVLADIAIATAVDKRSDRAAGGDRAPAGRSALLYQRGVVVGALAVEAMRLAQSHFDRRDIDPTQYRWALEHLKFDETKLDALGLAGMIAPFSAGCADHAGHAGLWLLEWNGRTFIRKAGPLSVDQGAIGPAAAGLAAQYIEANQPWTSNGTCRP